MRTLSIVVKVLAAAMLIAALAGNAYLFRQIEELHSQKVVNDAGSIEKEVVDESAEGITANEKAGCGEICRQEIAKAVSEAVSTISATTVVGSSGGTPVKVPGTSYVSIGSTYSTRSTDWVEVPDSGVYIDLINDFGEEAKVSWEASLKVANANGTAFARLYDDTNKIAVDFSEIKTEMNDTYEPVSSGELPFWRGRNLYKVQIKSLNSSEVTFTGGRVKVKY